MGIFLKWLELRESTSRKRRVADALAGRKPPLPGSYAANPRTEPRAMDVAAKTGLVKCPHCGRKDCQCGDDCSCRKDEAKSSKSPDYSLDKWIDKANDIGDDLSLLRKQGEEESDRLDKEIDKSKKEVEVDKEKEKKDKKDKKDKEADDKETSDSKEGDEKWRSIVERLKKKMKETSSQKEAGS